MVIKKLREFLGIDENDALKINDENQIEYAAAALLIEVAMVDRDFTALERERILNFVKEKFRLEDIIAQKLIKRAQAEVEGSVQLYAITKALRSGLCYEDRIDLMECLWMVAYADGKVDPFEDQLLRRIGELIYVTDRDRGIARKRAKKTNIPIN
ncbi:MAG: hypothetical protein CMM37_00385 [Rhodospirillaceae bacterium]|jgi:uncharacterized tellurite resistance protein B-like protein|nr:hypothetical protein [Rhodospirillaceae bacterium]|tara:strand:+ start:36 stop:500 length:465 start_codon:yes stop_codon:yes gene_type:complete